MGEGRQTVSGVLRVRKGGSPRNVVGLAGIRRQQANCGASRFALPPISVDDGTVIAAMPKLMNIASGLFGAERHHQGWREGLAFEPALGERDAGQGSSMFSACGWWAGRDRGPPFSAGTFVEGCARDERTRKRKYSYVDIPSRGPAQCVREPRTTGR